MANPGNLPGLRVGNCRATLFARLVPAGLLAHGGGRFGGRSLATGLRIMGKGGMTSDEEAQKAFWISFMKTDEAQEALKQQYRDEYDELNAEYEETVKPEELKQLGEALLDISREMKQVIAPILKYEFVQRILYAILVDCDAHGASFAEHVAKWETRLRLERLSEECRADPRYGEAIEDRWSKEVALKMHEENRKEQTEKVVTCDVQQLCALMNQGGLCCDMGLAKWREKNYELALERYTTGVGMLDHKRARGRENVELLTGMQCRLFRNQAAAALKLELYAMCVAACDKCLALAPRDVKALYRKGVALLRRGDFEAAERCFRRVGELEPASHDEALVLNAAKRDARAQLGVLARARAAHDRFSRDTFSRAFVERDGLFASDRAAADAPAPDEAMRAQMRAQMRKMKAEEDRRAARERERAAAAKPPPPPGASAPPAPPDVRLAYERVLELQRAVEALYASDAFDAALRATVRSCGGSERKVLAKLKDFLDEQRQTSGLLARFGFEESREGNRQLERAIGMYMEEQQVHERAQALMDRLMDTVRVESSQSS